MTDRADTYDRWVDLTITTVADRPELIDHLWDMPDGWPEFMNHDLISTALFTPVARAHRDLGVVATTADGTIVAHGTAMAFRLDADGRRDLPATGWDGALVWAHTDLHRGVEPDTAGALEVSVHSDWLGQGVSGRMVAALRDAARAQGFATLVAPVRPNQKHAEPDVSIVDYAARTRPDGLPADAWLRVHARLGGVIAKVAPASQTITGTLADWRDWTGLPFDTEGPTTVPAALAPVHCCLSGDYAVYVEPNVWVRHDLT